MTARVYNFSPGPAVLPLPVLEEAREHLLALPGVGISILESSHRSSWFGEILAEAEANLRRLMAIPQNYRVLFLQGGALLQFSMVPMNFLRAQALPADYLVTGSWTKKAVGEARREGEVHLCWDGGGKNFQRVPSSSELDLLDKSAYVYFTSNETIQGVQFRDTPGVGGRALVCDASSDFLSRPVPIEKYALLFACAQKNAGPAGVTVVIVHDDFLARRAEGLHLMLDYGQHAEAGSRLNTPNTFGVYLLMLITRWLDKEIGGLEQMAERNREKAELLYGVLDQFPDFFRGHAEKASRSLMNVTFRLPTPELEAAFLKEATARGLWELKGHRSVGGIRASIYNAMLREGVVALREHMLEYHARHA